MSELSDALEEIQALATEVNEKYSEYLESKEARDEAIRMAIHQGVSMYAIAQVTEMSQTAIAKIRNK